MSCILPIVRSIVSFVSFDGMVTGIVNVRLATIGVPCVLLLGVLLLVASTSSDGGPTEFDLVSKANLRLLTMPVFALPKPKTIKLKRLLQLPHY